MSVVIFIHHRDPRVIWFDDIADYDPTSAQIEGTVHAECSRPIEMAFLDIFQHTAHHAEDRIPLYRLRGAQRSLETRVGDRVLRVPLTLRSFLQTLSACQLYDYNRRQWLRCSDAKT
jgi:omega-6 fatty acid desaturase (delta-12 desaturase)